MKTENLEGAKKKVNKKEKEYVEVESNKVNNNYNKLLLLVVLIIGIGAIIWVLITNNVISFNGIVKDNKEDIELKHTESIKVKSEGVYITDVSQQKELDQVL